MYMYCKWSSSQTTHSNNMHNTSTECAAGAGAIELRQVDCVASGGLLKQSALDSKQVYVLDCHNDLFLWIGKKSTHLLRRAGEKLVQELSVMFQQGLPDAPAPPAAGSAAATSASASAKAKQKEEEKEEENAVTRRDRDTLLITTVLEHSEPLLFKLKFDHWVDESLSLDYTRTFDSIARRGELSKILEQCPMRADLSVLFTRRVPPVPLAHAIELMRELNAPLDKIDAYVLDSGSGKRFLRLPAEEMGHFYTHNSYVFVCRYLVLPEPTAEQLHSDADASGNTDGAAASNTNGEQTNADGAEEFQCTVYFWQGRFASNMGQLQFTFSFQKQFEKLFGDRLEVMKIRQQQEDTRFLAHFNRRFVIHAGARPSPAKPSTTAAERRNKLLSAVASNGALGGAGSCLSSAASSTPGSERGSREPSAEPSSSSNSAASAGPLPWAHGDRSSRAQLYQLRANNSPITSRCIEIEPDAALLNSAFCYLLQVTCPSSLCFPLLSAVS